MKPIKPVNPNYGESYWDKSDHFAQNDKFLSMDSIWFYLTEYVLQDLLGRFV